MKIAIDCRLYGLENGGVGRYIMELVNNLAEVDRENIYYLLFRTKYIDKLKFPENFNLVTADVPHYSLAEQRKIPAILGKLDIDLVHFPHFNVPLSFRGKFVVTLHDTIMHSANTDATTQKRLKYYLKKFAYLRVYKHAVKDSKAIIVPSNSVKQTLKDIYNINADKFFVTYEGVSFQDNDIKAKTSKEKYFIYTGSMYPHKNLHKLIEALVQLNKQLDEKVKLYIVGRKDIFSEKLEVFIDRFDAEKLVKFVGFIEDRKLAELYANSVAFVSPSISEGFGLPGLDAMQCGTLVACSDIPVFREIYKNKAAYFDPNSTQSIVTSLNSLLNINNSERKKQITINKKFAKNYSWKKMTEKTMNVYNAIYS